MQLVVHRDNRFLYFPIAIEAGNGEGVLTDLLPSDTVTISVVALTDEDHSEEVFSYRYALMDGPMIDPNVEPEEKGVLSCATGPNFFARRCSVFPSKMFCRVSCMLNLDLEKMKQ